MRRRVMASAVLLCTTGALSFPSILRKSNRPVAFLSFEIPNSSRRWIQSAVTRPYPLRQRHCTDAVTSKCDEYDSFSVVQTLASSKTHVNAYKPRRLCVAPMLDWTDRFDRYFLRVMSKHTWLYTEMVTTGAIIFGDQVFPAYSSVPFSASTT